MPLGGWLGDQGQQGPLELKALGVDASNLSGDVWR
jgi:hypothetical protein